MDRRGTGPSSGNELSGRVSGTVMQFGRIDQAHFHGDGPSRIGPPRQLPPITTLFTGRREDCDRLDRQWEQAGADRTGVLFVISGTAGVGKTSLAIAWSQAHSGEFPDGQLYADLAGYSQQRPADSEDILGGFLRALGVAPDRVPAQLAERVALLRTITHERRVCVLLDNAVSAAQVRVLAMTAPGCATLVTTRGSISGLTMDGARFHQLDPWRAETGVAFIQRALGEERVREEPDAARRVAELCGGLPLAIGVAAAKLASRPRSPRKGGTTKRQSAVIRRWRCTGGWRTRAAWRRRATAGRRSMRGSASGARPNGSSTGRWSFGSGSATGAAPRWRIRA